MSKVADRKVSEFITALDQFISVGREREKLEKLLKDILIDVEELQHELSKIQRELKL